MICYKADDKPQSRIGYSIKETKGHNVYYKKYIYWLKIYLSKVYCHNGNLRSVLLDVQISKKSRQLNIYMTYHSFNMLA